MEVFLATLSINIYQMLPLLSTHIQFKIFKEVKFCPLMLFSVVILPRQTYNDPLFRSEGSPAHSFIFCDFISPEQGYVNFSSRANKIWSEVIPFTTKDCHEYLIQTGAFFSIKRLVDSNEWSTHFCLPSLRRLQTNVDFFFDNLRQSPVCIFANSKMYVLSLWQ